MRVLVTDNAHVFKNENGEYFTNSIYGSYFFDRYLNVFEDVRFLCKTKYINNKNCKDYIKICNDRLEIFELPWYQGIIGLIKNIIPLIKKIRNATKDCSCCIFRVAQIESFLSFYFSKINIPYALEIVNDPLTFSNRNIIYKLVNIVLLKDIIRNANGISCVTEKYLQKKYLKNSRSYKSSYSSIELNEEDIGNQKKYPSANKYFTLVHTSNSMIGNDKGNITVINVLKVLKNNGIKAKVIFIGDGPSKNDYIKLCKKYNILDYITFTGRIKNKNEILKILRESDMFIFPSISEGLSRSIIEAQASGLPCLASLIGSNMELLDRKYLIKPSNVNEYVKRISTLINKPQELERMSIENISVAKKFLKKEIEKTRYEFYKKLKILANNCKR